jgi:cryptochrome
VGVNRLRFLLESLACVSASITALNARSQLLVVRGNPAELLPELLRRWQITHLVFEKDDNGYARTRDAAVREIAKDAGVELVDVDGHQLYPVSEVLKRAGGKAPMTMQSLQKVSCPRARH